MIDNKIFKHTRGVPESPFLCYMCP